MENETTTTPETVETPVVAPESTTEESAAQIAEAEVEAATA